MSGVSEVSGAGDNTTADEVKATSIEDENGDVKRIESTDVSSDIEYDDDENEPELHARTYVAVLAMFLLNMVQVLALQGPPAVLTFIGRDLNAATQQTWIPNSLSLVQAVVGPVISFGSDTFQARKSILVTCSIISFIGAAIAPGASSIGRVIAAQTLIGFGFATVPLAYSVPSEILPRRWRPMTQAAMNIAAAIGACVGPLVIGALTKRNVHTGWRNFYWFQMALWAVIALGIAIGYKPPKRHTLLDHLSLWQKLGRLDLPGSGLLTVGLTLFLVGLNLGGGANPWIAAKVLGPLVIGICVLIAFAVYEWKVTSTGILHHELFRGGRNRGQTFSMLVSLIFIEAILLFTYVLFYPQLTEDLFVTDPLAVVVRLLPFWIACAISTVIYGYASTKLRSIRSPMLVGYAIYTAGIIGLATIQPSQSTNAIVFAALAGLGFGAPLILIVAGVQLSTPHHLIAIATAVTTSARAVAATVFTAIYAAAVSSRMTTYIPDYISKSALENGLPKSSIKPFIEALTSQNTTAIHMVPGVNQAITRAGTDALHHAYADGLRVVFIIAAPFGVLACVICYFLGDLKKTMNYHVDAPIEKLHARQRPEGSLT
ncbi:putative siderophore iron transporter [Penicillium brasilianum]|uniref:Putative siderophore iron transporter n=1 Tax=Penicillium brasilianum TaxID=104259 RepID=A0A1S9RG50_PENBI|nr:putative siderophore iron transporter [Penicillium brasilianum]